MTTRHHLSHADKLFRGSAFYAPLFVRNQRTGIEFMPLTKISLGAPEAADDDGLVDAATSTELPNNATIVYTTADDGTTPFDNADTPAPASVVMADGEAYSVWTLDVPRNVTGVVSHSTTSIAMTVIVAGFDEYGEAMTELFTFGASAQDVVVAGKKAFKHIRSFTIASGGNATANTLNMGWGNVLGLPYRLNHASDLFSAFAGGTSELGDSTVVAGDAQTATNATGDVRGTITFDTAANGTAVFNAWMHVADPNTKSGLVGVSQA